MIRRTRSDSSVLRSRDVLRGLIRGAAVLALLLAAAPATAQIASPQARDNIQRNTRPGDRLTLDIRGGPEVRGRLLSAGADALVLERDGQQQSFQYVSIDRVRRRRNGVWLGTIIGLGAGPPLGTRNPRQNPRRVVVALRAADTAKRYCPSSSSPPASAAGWRARRKGPILSTYIIPEEVPCATSPSRVSSTPICGQCRRASRLPWTAPAVPSRT